MAVSTGVVGMKMNVVLSEEDVLALASFCLTAKLGFPVEALKVEPVQTGIFGQESFSLHVHFSVVQSNSNPSVAKLNLMPELKGVNQ
jgi:hypothetical protein